MGDFDVQGIENVIGVVFGPNSSPADRLKAQEMLDKFKESPDSWYHVPTILENSKHQETKYFALQVLDKVILYRWKTLPREQCDGMRAFIVNKIVQLSSSEQSLRSNKVYLQKLNQTLVQILKQEWPNNWGSFIGDIISSSSTNENLCENNMCILKLLSEEIFDFSRNQMTHAKAQMLKEQFKSEFTLIYQLCEWVLTNSQRLELLLVTLESFQGFICWIPPQYTFESQIIRLLVNKFLPLTKLRNTAVACLNEIVSLQNIGNYQETLFAELLKIVLQQLNTFLRPVKDKIVELYRGFGSADQTFFHNLAMFFASLFKNHLAVFENTPAYHPALLEGHTYLACLTYVEDEEIFKICLDYWSVFAENLYRKSANSPLRTPNPYAEILQLVRVALISNMPKPEEVFIIEDENGDIVKEESVDTNAIILYKTMRDTLIFLTHLSPQETISIMKEKLTGQVNGQEYSWHNLNTLCWAVGSISGAQSEEEEKRFLVQVIKELLQMCDNRKKEDKAVIASNIMYIVGQYPRFLNKHWSFLKTVVLKLFEFMHEMHPGIAEMACDTFLKISKACRQNFVISHKEEPQPYIYHIIEKVDVHTSGLDPTLTAMFYEATAIMIAANTDEVTTKMLIFQLMSKPNAKWEEILNSAGQNRRFLFENQIAKNITNFLKINVRTAVSLGNLYLCQLEKLFINLLHIYRFYSEEISTSIATQGAQVAKYSNIRAYRMVKREILRLLQTFIHSAVDYNFVSKTIIPPLFSAILDDYQNNHPDARDPEVISLISVVVEVLKATICQEIPKIFTCVIHPTILMIQTNFQEFPDHRVNLFNLIRAINSNCFQSFFIITPDQFKLAIDSIVWAFKHTMRNVADTGLITLYELWTNIERSDAANGFFKLYLLSLLNDLLSVLTDSLHKSGFKMQAALIMMIINSVQTGKVGIPLWDQSNASYPNNQAFLGEFIVKLVSAGCQNLSQQQVIEFAKGLFAHSQNTHAFNQHLRDFLVNMKEFADADNSELYREDQELKEQQEAAQRSAVPGLLKPIDLELQQFSQSSNAPK